MQPISIEKDSSRPTGLLPLIFLILSVCGATIGQLGAVASWISEDLGLNKSQMGMAQTFFYLGSLMGALCSRKVIERFSVRRVFVGCLLGMALGAFLCSLPVYGSILLGRGITGLGFSMMVVLCTSIMAVRYESQKTMLMSLVHATVGGSVAITLFSGQWFGEIFGTWSALFWLSGAMVLAVSALALMVNAGDLKGEEKCGEFSVKSPSWPERLKDPILLMAMGIGFGYLIVEQSLTMFLQVWAMEVLQASPTEGAGIAGALWLGVIVGRIFTASVISEERSLQMLVMSGVFCSLCVYFLSSSTSLEEAVPMVFISGFWAGPVIPLAFAFLAKETRLPQVTAASSCQVFICLGGLVGPFLVGFVADTTSLETGIFLAYSLMFLTMVPPIFLWMKRSLGFLFVKPQDNSMGSMRLQGR